MKWLVVVLGLLMSSSTATSDSTYVYRRPSGDGTGKVYMGREIAVPLGHVGADWLERSGREREEAPAVLLRELSLEADDVVADIGAGTGYFTFRIAPLVPKGTVFAVDIDTAMIADLRARMKRDGVRNVVPVLGKIDDPELPADKIDVALMVDAYHEFSHPREMMRVVVRSLREGGRVVLVEYRGEDRDLAIKPHHKMTESQARLEMEAAGLGWVETKEVLPRQHLMIFRK